MTWYYQMVKTKDGQIGVYEKFVRDNDDESSQDDDFLKKEPSYAGPILTGTRKEIIEMCEMIIKDLQKNKTIDTVDWEMKEQE